MRATEIHINQLKQPSVCQTIRGQAEKKEDVNKHIIQGILTNGRHLLTPALRIKTELSGVFNIAYVLKKNNAPDGEPKVKNKQIKKNKPQTLSESQMSKSLDLLDIISKSLPYLLANSKQIVCRVWILLAQNNGDLN